LTRVIQVLEVLTDCPYAVNNVDKHLTFVILDDLFVLLKLRSSIIKILLSSFAKIIPLIHDVKDIIVSSALLLRLVLMEPLVLARFTVEGPNFITLALLSANVLDLILTFAFTQWNLVISFKELSKCQ
jgi:hypothetical protein